MAFRFVSPEISFINWIFYIIAICLIFFYVSASVALFTKASNLTNRGIVSHFPYNIIRHPAYISKIGLWWLASFCVIKNLIDTQMYSKVILFIITAIIWTFIYFLRALTEERHLMLDPDYREYAEKVKYRFIPFVFQKVSEFHPIQSASIHQQYFHPNSLLIVARVILLLYIFHYYLNYYQL